MLVYVHGRIWQSCTLQRVRYNSAPNRDILEDNKHQRTRTHPHTCVYSGPHRYTYIIGHTL